MIEFSYLHTHATDHDIKRNGLILLKFTCDPRNMFNIFPAGLELEKFTTSWKRTGGLTFVCNFVFIHFDKQKLSM